MSDHLALVDDQDPIGDGDQLIELTGDQQHTGAGVARRADLGVDRVVPQLGSQKPEAVADKLKELERFVRVAACTE